MRQQLENLRTLLTVGMFQGLNGGAVAEALSFVDGMIAMHTPPPAAPAEVVPVVTFEAPATAEPEDMPARSRRRRER